MLGREEATTRRHYRMVYSRQSRKRKRSVCVLDLTADEEIPGLRTHSAHPPRLRDFYFLNFFMHLHETVMGRKKKRKKNSLMRSCTYLLRDPPSSLFVLCRACYLGMSHVLPCQRRRSHDGAIGRLGNGVPQPHQLGPQPQPCRGEQTLWLRGVRRQREAGGGERAREREQFVFVESRGVVFVGGRWSGERKCARDRGYSSVVARNYTHASSAIWIDY